MASYKELQESVVMGQKDKIKEQISTLLKENNAPLEIITDGLMAGMSIVGSKMKAEEMFIPEVLSSAHAMREGMELLQPLVVGELSTIHIGKVVIGTVEGDIHSIGKTIVCILLESGGFTVVDAGVDVSTDRFIELVQSEHPDILGLSSLLTSTMPRMKDIIETLKRKGLRDKVRVMVGGAPVTQSFADSIGADGYAEEAVSVLDKARQLTGH